MAFNFDAANGGITSTLPNTNPSDVEILQRLTGLSAYDKAALDADLAYQRKVNDIRNANSYTTVSVFNKNQIKASEETIIASTEAGRTLQKKDIASKIFAAQAMEPPEVRAKVIAKLREEYHDVERADMNWFERRVDDWNQSRVGSKTNKSFTDVGENAGELSYTDALVLQDNKSKDLKKICDTKPYWECSTCQLANSKLDSAAFLKKLFGNRGVDDAAADAMRKGDTRDIMANCPGRQRELKMQDLDSAEGFWGTAAAMGKLSLQVGTNSAAMMNTAIAGNPTLYRNAVEAATNGDMSVIAKDQFPVAAGAIGDSNPIIKEVAGAGKDIGIKGDSLIKASVPGGFLGSSSFENAIDLKKLQGVSNLSAGSQASMIKSMPGVFSDMVGNLSSITKRADKVSRKMGNGKTARENSEMDDTTREMIRSQYGDKIADSYW